MIGLMDLNIANQLCLLMTGGHRTPEMVGLKEFFFKILITFT